MTTRTIGLATALALLACGGGGLDVAPPPPLDTGGTAAPEPEPEPVTEDADCPDGVVVMATWPGEWPSPVVQVTAPTAVKGYATLCAASPEVDCVVPEGLYNPWSTGPGEYRSLSTEVTYETTEAVTVGGKELPAGSEVVMRAYLAEGYCTLVVGGEEIEDTCPEVMGLAPDGPYRQTSEPIDFPERQFIGVECEGGGKAWLIPEDVLAKPTAQEGEYVEYGQVGPKGSGGF